MIFELAAWLGALLLMHCLKMIVLFGRREPQPDRYTRVAGLVGATLFIVGLAGVAANKLMGH